jgi:hypothetical protein
MKPLYRILFLIAFFIPTTPSHLNASEALELNERVQAGLIAAKPLRGQGVNRQLFNGKPVLVVFFASW